MKEKRLIVTAALGSIPLPADARHVQIAASLLGIYGHRGELQTCETTALFDAVVTRRMEGAA